MHSSGTGLIATREAQKLSGILWINPVILSLRRMFKWLVAASGCGEKRLTWYQLFVDLSARPSEIETSSVLTRPLVTIKPT